MLFAESDCICDMEQCIKDEIWDDAEIYCPETNRVYPIKGHYRKYQYVDEIETSTKLRVTEEWIEVLCKDIADYASPEECCIRIRSKANKEGRWFKVRDVLAQSHSKFRLTLKRCKEKFDPVLKRDTVIHGVSNSSKGRQRNPMVGA